MVWLAVFAIVLVVILKVWPKGLWLVLAGAALLLVCIVYFNEHAAQQRDLVRITVAYERERCPAERPLRVVITNDAENTLDRVLFSIQAVVPGYSTVVTPYTYKQYDSPKILEPGEQYAACFAMPRFSRETKATVDLPSLEWSAQAEQVFFSVKNTFLKVNVEKEHAEETIREG